MNDLSHNIFWLIRTVNHNKCYVLITGFIIIGIQPLGRSGQRPELSQATGMARLQDIFYKFQKDNTFRST